MLISNFTLEYFIVMCLLIVNYSKAIQFHACGTLHRIWSSLRVLCCGGVVLTASHLPGWASFGLCVTKHCRIFVLPLCHLMTRYMLRLCLLKRKYQVGNLVAC